MPATMRAAVLEGHGGPERLRVRDDVPMPVAGAGQVLLEVGAAAVNNTDVWTRRGAYGSPADPDAVAGWRGVPLDFPRIQGADVVGRVVACGDGVDEAWAGRRVLVDPALHDGRDLVAVLGSELDGGFASHLAVDVAMAHDVTDAPMDDAELACLPTAWGTATGMLERAEVVAGETIVVTGASGGVGQALVQLARVRGATTIAVTSAAHVDAVRADGADHVVARGGEGFADRVRQVAGGEVDVVADVVGGGLVHDLVDLLRTEGRLVTCGAVAGPVVELDLRQLYLRSRRLIGSTMHTPEQFRRLVDHACRGELAPRIGQTYPLDEIHQAQDDLVEGRWPGKLVLLP